MKDKEKPVKRRKKPWPTKAAMEQVYSRKLWGDNQSPFYSGEGSHDPEITGPYLKVVTSFLKSFESPPIVCDLGCGDFNVGKELISYSDQYIAVDIVEPLIKYNSENYTEENLEFQCLDIAADDLPAGDVVILRQVLQHLSNNEIQKILDKLRIYEYLILTEHLPKGEFVPNKDIISGQGTRLKNQSGINIMAPPFNFEVKKEELLSSVTLENNKGIIVTRANKIK